MTPPADSSVAHPDESQAALPLGAPAQPAPPVRDLPTSIEFARREGRALIAAGAVIDVALLARAPEEKTWRKAFVLQPRDRGFDRPGREWALDTPEALDLALREAALAADGRKWKFPLRGKPDEWLVPALVFPAVRVGSLQLAVLDIDKHEGGADGFETLAKLGINPDDHPSAITPNGGKHLIFRRTAGSPARKRPYPDHGLDLLTSSERRKRDLLICYESARHFIDAPPIPDDLQEKVKALGRDAQSRKRKAAGASQSSAGSAARGARSASLDDLVATIRAAPQGSRHAAIRDAGNAAHREAAGPSPRWTADEADRRLLEAGLAAGKAEAEIRKLLGDCRKWGAKIVQAEKERIHVRIDRDLFGAGRYLRRDRATDEVLIWDTGARAWREDARNDLRHIVQGWLEDPENGIELGGPVARAVGNHVQALLDLHAVTNFNKSVFLAGGRRLLAVAGGSALPLDGFAARPAEPEDMLDPRRSLGALPALAASDEELEGSEFFRMSLRSFGDDREVVDYLLERLAAPLVRAQKRPIVVLYGASDGGKSLHSDMFEAFYAGYAQRIPRSLMQNANVPIHSEHEAKLAGALAAVSNEGGKYWGWPLVQWLKDMTGGGQDEVRTLYKAGMIPMKREHTFLISTNHAPSISFDEGLNNRLAVFHFPLEFGPGHPERDDDLDARLAQPEQVALFGGLLVRAARRWLARGRPLAPPEACVRAKANFINQGDQRINDWVADRIIGGEAGRTEKVKAWKDFEGWCKEGGLKAGLKRDFYQYIGHRFGEAPITIDMKACFPFVLASRDGYHPLARGTKPAKADDPDHYDDSNPF